VIDENDDKNHQQQSMYADKPHTKDELTSTAQQFLRQMASSLLRAMAGGLFEADYFLRDLSAFLEANEKLNRLHGSKLVAADVDEALRLPHDKSAFPHVDDCARRQALREVGIEEIVKGSLRLAAHQILRQRPYFGGKHSTKLILEGIGMLEVARD
jgi:hypothetical protein